MTYEFNWKKELDTGSGTLKADSLHRSAFAETLTSYVVSQSEESDYVLNLNAPWGEGKTYFIKRWMESLKKYHAVVYVDAWKNDYSDDPLLTIVNELKEQMSSQIELGSVEDLDFSRIGLLIKVGALGVGKGLLKKLIGADCDDIESNYENEISDGAAMAAKVMLETHAQQKNAMKDFRIQLSRIGASISGDSKIASPIFVFVDELDRCRPSYAIELLEVIKHLFDVKNFVFIVSTDTDQLEHSIKAIYGDGFDAANYLGRFFTQRVALPESNRLPFIQDSLLIDQLEELNEWLSPAYEMESYCKFLNSFFEKYKCELRTIKKVLSRVMLALAQASSKEKTVDLLFLVVGVYFREKNPTLLREIMSSLSTPQIFPEDRVLLKQQNNDDSPLSFQASSLLNERCYYLNSPEQFDDDLDSIITERPRPKPLFDEIMLKVRISDRHTRKKSCNKEDYQALFNLAVLLE